MSKVLLVSLRSPFLDSDRVFPPIGIMQLKACLDSAGHEATVVDGFGPEDAKMASSYDVAAFSVMTPQGRDAADALEIIKRDAPGVVTVVGGPHALHYRDVVEAQPWDHIVPADGERVIVQIADAVQHRQIKLDRVLVDQLTPDQMNATPRPWRENPFLSNYRYDLDGRKITTMLTTRGCPMACRFCEDRRTTVRHYSPERVEAELQDVVRLGFGGVMFFDDIFAMIPQRTKVLTEIVSRYDLKYRCFAHANTLKEEMAKQLAESGCVEVGFGCEHASQKILDNIGKGVKVRQNVEFLERCRRYGIRVKAFFIIGLPGEDLETVRELETFIAEQTENGNLYDFDLTVYYPYRGTVFRDEIDQWDLTMSSDADKALGYYKGKGGSADIIVRTSALSGEEIRAHKDRIYHAHNRRFKNVPHHHGETSLVPTNPS